MLGRTENSTNVLVGLAGTPSWAEGESELPDGVEEIGYELYPKNGDQIWQSYKQYSQEQGFDYDDELVLRETKKHIVLPLSASKSFCLIILYAYLSSWFQQALQLLKR